MKYKSVIVLTMILLVSLLIPSFVIAQQTALDSLITQAGPVVTIPTGVNHVFYIVVLVSIIIGHVSRIVWDTNKGIKNTQNNTPLVLSPSYWLKDNLFPKLASILPYLLSFPYIMKISVTNTLPIYVYIVVAIIGFGMGVFLDYVVDKIKVVLSIWDKFSTKK